MADRMIIDCIIFLIARSMIGLRVQASQQPPPGILLLDVLVLRDDRQWRVLAFHQQQPSRSGSQHHFLSSILDWLEVVCARPTFLFRDQIFRTRYRRLSKCLLLGILFIMAHECVFCYPQNFLY
jgi:hypothetical protein